MHVIWNVYLLKAVSLIFSSERYKRTDVIYKSNVELYMVGDRCVLIIMLKLELSIFIILTVLLCDDVLALKQYMFIELICFGFVLILEKKYSCIET